MARDRTGDDRRERMAGLLELMQDECRVRELSYADEMATMVIVWLGGCTLDEHGPVAKKLMRGGLPIDLSDVKKPFDQSKRKISKNHKPAAPPSEPRRGTKSYRLGVEAFEAGRDREACPYEHGQGGFRRDWLAGFDESDVAVESTVCSGEVLR